MKSKEKALALVRRISDAWTMFKGEHPKDPEGYVPWWTKTGWLGVEAVHTLAPRWWRWDMKKQELKRILLGTYFVKHGK